jgi:hypothetical protein
MKITSLENLTSLLCEVEEVNKDIMELRFWTKIRYWSYIVDFLYHFEWEDVICWKYWLEDWIIAMNRKIDEIIWNPIEYHHLMMYCDKSQKLQFNIFWNYISIRNLFTRNDSWLIYLNNNLPLHQQSEETLWKIYNFLKW